MNALRYKFLVLTCLGAVSAWAQPPMQSMIRGYFLTDSIEIGRPFRYSLMYRHSSRVDVLFPDTATYFRPYRVQKIDVYATQTDGTDATSVSRDSAVYTLVSFETDSTQLLRVPIRIINETDCTALWTQMDTVFLRSKLSTLQSGSVGSGNLALATETKLAPLQQQFNYSALLRGFLLLGVAAVLLYGLFGRAIRRQWRLYQLNRRHLRFLRNYNQLSQRLNSFTASETANQAVVMWKIYLEQLDRQPYVALTTPELAERINDKRVTDALRETDRMIYGGTFSPQSQPALWTLRDVATQVYHRSRARLRRSVSQTGPTNEQLDSPKSLLSPERMEPWYSLHWFIPAQWNQFHIANPLALVLIPAVLLLFLVRYYLHRNAQQRLNISLDPLTSPHTRGREIRAQTTRSLLSSLRYMLPISMFLGISFVLIALARPQIVREQRDEQAEGIDIMLAIDVSASMSESDLPPTRLAAARRVAQTFVNGRQNDRIGLVVFAGEAFSLCPLTTDYGLLKQYLNDLNHQMIRTSGTAIGDALARCINRMRGQTISPTDTTQKESGQWKKERSKIIILLSDGDNTAGNLDPVTAARLAKLFNIRLYTIAVGRAVPSTSKAVTVDEGVLKTIATIGNGSFFRATDARRLRTVFAQISHLEKSPVRVQIYEDVQDYYRIYLYWGICFLLFALFLKNTIFGNVLED